MRRVTIAILILLSITVFSPFVRVEGSNQAPVASFTYSPADPYAQETITFDASASYDPDGIVVSYQWDFGDGNVATVTTSIVTHCYLDCGSYVATLTVTDNGGLTSFTSQTIAVINPAHLHLWAEVGSYVGYDPDDWIEESWVVSSDVPAGGSISFDLYIYNKDKDPTYDVYLAVAVDDPLQVASITIGTATYTTFEYGEVTWPDVAGDGKLPRHGVYPTWYVLAPFGNIDSNYGYYYYPYDPYYAFRAYTPVTITTSLTMNAGFKVHFDAQGVLLKGSTDSKNRNNSPYSHDLTFEGSLYIPPQADLSITKSGPEYAHVGDEITYKFTVANAGPDKAVNVVVTDSLLGDIYGPKDLAAGVSETFTVKYIVKATDPDPLVNTATVTSDTQDPNLMNNEASWTVDILQPGIEVSKSGPSSAHEGDTITYTITVTNTGGSLLSSVSVTDSILAKIYSGDLDIGQTLSFNKPYSVPVGGVDPIVNTATASGTDELGQTVLDSTSWTVDILHPAIKVTKSGPLQVHEGDTITYTITVENTGDCPLSEVTVKDYLLGDLYSDGLAVGEKKTFQVSYTVPKPSGDVPNTVTASGKDALGFSVTDSASWIVDILHPAIDGTKTADKAEVYAGETIIYMVTVKNTGDCILYGVKVNDTLLGQIWSGTLGVGESKTFTPIYAAKLGDTDPLVNTVTASGKDILGLEVTDEDAAEVDLIAKICGYKFCDANKNGVRDAGEPPVEGIKIELWLAGSKVAETTTGYDGKYCLDELNAGTFTVKEVLPPNWINTTPISLAVTINSGEVSEENNFGNIKVGPLSVSTSPTTVKIKMGESVTFVSSVSGGEPPYCYQWYLDWSAVAGATSFTWTFTSGTTGSYTVYMIVTDGVGGTAKSNEASVTVAPKLTVSISPTSASLLVGQSVTFSLTVSGGYPPYSYQWYLNGDPVSGATSSTWTFTSTASGAYYVYLKITDAAGNVAQSGTASITVPPPSLPVGGEWVPINKFQLLAPWISLASLITVAAVSVVYVKHRKKKQN